MPDPPSTARSTAADLFRKAAQNKTVRRAATTAASSAGSWLAKSGVERFGARRAAKEQVALAEGLARQIGAKLSYDTVIGTETYTVVWSEGKPLAAFPPIDGNEGLDRRPELTGFAESSLKEPPPENARRSNRGAMPEARQDYDIRLDEKYGHLELIDVRAEAAAHEPWFNQTLTSVNDTVVRVGVLDGDFHWHKHDDTDEFFLVLDGRLLIDLEDRDTVTLDPHQGYTVPRGVVHRTRAPGRVTILMVEAAGVAPTGD